MSGQQEQLRLQGPLRTRVRRPHGTVRVVSEVAGGRHQDGAGRRRSASEVQPGAGRGPVPLPPAQVPLRRAAPPVPPLLLGRLRGQRQQARRSTLIKTTSDLLCPLITLLIMTICITFPGGAKRPKSVAVWTLGVTSHQPY